jgi:carbon monoxide dehydrogenase subunit G
MALQTTGEISVAVDRTRAFEFLQNAEQLAACIPGCRDVREIAPGRYTAVLSSRVAFMTLNFNVTIELVKVVPPATLEATISGDAIGLAGHVAAHARVELLPDDDRRTTVRYYTDVGLTGKLGGLGESVFRATSAKLSREFGINLKTALERQPTETRV